MPASVPQLYDAHCHLDLPAFQPDLSQVLARATAAGVGSLILAGISAATWPRLLSLSHKYPQIYACLGLHPYFVQQHRQTDLNTLQQLLTQAINPPSNHPQTPSNKIVALGEIGVDLYTQELRSQAEQQWHLFNAQLELAQQLGVPVVIHARKSLDKVLQRLRYYQLPQGGLLHAFTGSLQQAEQLVSLNFRLGLGGALTYPRANKLRQVAQTLPLSAFLLETDSPDMPLHGWQGQRNEPARVALIAQELASLRQTSVACLLPQLYANLHLTFPLLTSN